MYLIKNDKKSLKRCISLKGDKGKRLMAVQPFSSRVRLSLAKLTRKGNPLQ